MASKIKVDNIENQCGGAVVTKCGATTTISGSVVKADDIQAADGGNLINQCGTTITLGASGDTISLASGASQTGFGRTGTVDWDTTPKTASFTAVSGNGYFVNTTSGAIIVTLPATPSAGDIVAVADYAGTASTNNINIARNGSNIEGGVVDASIQTSRETKTLVYVDGTQGWLVVNSNDEKLVGSQFICASGGTITECGDYKTHIFTGPGTFTVNCVAPGPSGNPNSIDYFVVGGGAGGAGNNGGGGGAGGFRVSNCAAIPAPTMSPLVNACGAITATVEAFPITVGAGGAPGPFPATDVGGSGSSSIFSTITSTGGGGGGTRGAPTANGTPGSSGGGGGGEDGGSAGTGNTPPVSPAQGNNGGTGGGPGSPRASGGGGGAIAAGTPGVPSQCAGPGGAGSFIADAFIGPTAPTYGTPGPVGSTRYFAGGGGGAVESSPTLGLGSNGTGGVGGGGQAGPAPTTGGAGTAGTTNTGGGGGGASRYNCGSAPVTSGGSGGSGIVMIRYKFQ
jgi:hypothetical protein